MAVTQVMDQVARSDGLGRMGLFLHNFGLLYIIPLAI